ncbi:hypothetical protein PG993_012202 [Apiospora rasikravindrae]|uniref:Uncharacterized protein n=1 Tax=Apiospora rasikravindrae TaxID=990691 RepID=A0ABR1S1T7_9PEZI
MIDTKSNPTKIVCSGSSVTRWDAQGHWDGQLPCSYGYKYTCRIHNSTLRPIYHNPLLDAPKSSRWNLPDIPAVCKKLRYFAHSSVRVTDSLESVASDDEAKPLKEVSLVEGSPPFLSGLPFDVASILTLDPMHPAMPYGLAFYHLNYARRQLKPTNSVAFVPELSCSSRSRFGPRGPSFDWTSEVYYNSGSFFQRQEIRCILDEGRNQYPPLEICFCHHQQACFSDWTLENKDGHLAASAKISFAPGRYNHDRGYTWRNDRGANLADLHICTCCHCDFEYNVEVVGRQVNVRFACYKDLGAATDRFEPKWRCHLTDKGLSITRDSPWRAWTGEIPCRSDSLRDYELYRYIWQTAKKLNRPNLHLVMFEAARGEFQSSSDSKDYLSNYFRR